MTDRRRFLQGSLASGAVLLVPAAGLAKTDPWAMRDAILKRIRPPAIPRRDFPLEGAGLDAINRAIAACHAAGGGRVIVPAGEHLTGPIRLLGKVELHLEKGALVRFSRDPNDYLPLVLTRWEGVELMNYSPLIYAFGQSDIAVTGEGELDGQASDAYWWPWKGKASHGWKTGDVHQGDARARLFKMGDENVPVAQRIFGEGSYLRPGFFEPYRCNNVMISGVTVRNMPFWEIHPVLCRNVIVRGLTIDSAGPNTDGCDPESCADVLIENCTFNTGDDCIAVKAGRNGDGRRVSVPTEYVVIRNCAMKDGHGALTVGSEITGGVRWLFAENCTMSSPHLDHAIRFKNNAYRGGVLEHFYFRNIAIGQVRSAVTIDFNYEEGAKGAFHPVLRDVMIENLTCDEAVRAIDMQGLANAVVADIALRNCDFRRVREANIVKHVARLRLDNVRIDGRTVR